MGNYLLLLDEAISEGIIDRQFQESIFSLHDHFQTSMAHHSEKETSEELFNTLIFLILKNIRNPYPFSIFHESIRQPFDYYQFGLDFIRLFVDENHSSLQGVDAIRSIEELLQKKENVILFANHQIEADPQILSILLKNISSHLATQMIFIAGHRVITDPMAIPLSLGRNLLCIYSKRHISSPPEEKGSKILHNQKTLQKMKELLDEGGKCIFVAPSGGRDRPNEMGVITVSPFDSQSIELFYLLGKQAKYSTHFYPLALHTYPLMPPPKEVEQQIGEKRILRISPVHACFGNEIEMEHIGGQELSDKKTKREERAKAITHLVQELYASLSHKTI